MFGLQTLSCNPTDSRPTAYNHAFRHKYAITMPLQCKALRDRERETDLCYTFENCKLLFRVWLLLYMLVPYVFYIYIYICGQRV